MIIINGFKLPDNTNAIKLEPSSLDVAVIGYNEKKDVLIYHANILIDCFMHQGMTEDEAWEWFNYNTLGAITSNYPSFVYE